MAAYRDSDPNWLLFLLQALTSLDFGVSRSLICRYAISPMSACTLTFCMGAYKPTPHMKTHSIFLAGCLCCLTQSTLKSPPSCVSSSPPCFCASANWSALCRFSRGKRGLGNGFLPSSIILLCCISEGQKKNWPFNPFSYQGIRACFLLNLLQKPVLSCLTGEGSGEGLTPPSFVFILLVFPLVNSSSNFQIIILGDWKGRQLAHLRQ